MNHAELTLVPPHRLGALLTRRRNALGLTVEEVASELTLPVSADELRAIEQGQRPLSDDQVNRLLEAYQAGAEALVPGRAELRIDLPDGRLSAGDQVVDVAHDAEVDDVLGRYLTLLYLLRDLEPGAPLSLRGGDLDVLAGALERAVTEVEERLFTLMAPAPLASWYARLRHRIAVPAAGVLVGLTAVGSLVLVEFPDGPRAQTTSSPESLGVVDAAATEVGGIVVTPPAGLVTATSAASPEIAAIGAEAEARISYPYRELLPGWTIVFDAPHEGYRGNTNTVSRTIHVYVRDDDTAGSVAGVLAHEIGHALDVMYLDADARQAWLDIRGIEGPWWPESGRADFHVGAGDFAEAVAAMIADSPSEASRGWFTPDQLALLEDLLPEHVS